MSATVELLTGIAGVGKTDRLLDEYRSALRESVRQQSPGRTLWLAPTQRARRSVLNALLDDSLPVCFAPNVLTFDEFAERVLQLSDQKVSLLGDVAKRALVRKLIDDLHRRGELRYFSSIVHTSGFLDLVLAFISELKRDETWPDQFRAACQARGEDDKDRELALIYREYQDHLQRHGLYDAEGRFWSARTVLTGSQPPAEGEGENAGAPFEQLSLVVADGFTDFTLTQYEILEALARRSDRMMISLPLESPPRRDDLFAKSAAAQERLLQMTDGDIAVRVTTTRSQALVGNGLPFSGRSPAGDRGKAPPLNAKQTFAEVRSQAALEHQFNELKPAAFAHVAENLFANPRHVEPLDRAEGIELLAVTGQLGEVEELAARVKGLLLSGVPAEDVVVAFRSVDDTSDLVEEVFTAAGIPFWCEAGTRLIRAPILKALFAVLQLERDDWPFDQLMAVLDSNYFHPRWKAWHNGLAARDVAAQLRRLKLHSGRRTILQALERVAGSRGVKPPGSQRSPQNVRLGAHVVRPQPPTRSHSDDTQFNESVYNALALLQKLSSATAGLRKKGDFAQWANRVRKLGRELGIVPGGSRDWRTVADDPSSDHDRRVRDRFDKLLADAQRGESLGGAEFPKRDLAEFTRQLHDLLQADSLPPAKAETGKVLVLESANVRGLDVPYLFLAGLTEDSFPQQRPDDCLYNESERRRLNQHGLTLGHRSSRNQDEMLMFYSVVTRARQRLVLSYPAVSAKGQPLFPSPYVTAVKCLFTPEALTTTPAGELDPVPPGDRILSPADLRLSATVQVHENHAGLFRALLEEPATAPTAQNILAAVDMAVQRFHTNGFTNYEGLVQHPVHRQRLQELFPRDYEFSATQLEYYAGCPFRFFLRDLLNAEPLSAPDVVTDLKERGQLVHQVLAELHRLAAEDETQPSVLAPERLADRFRKLVAGRLGRRVLNSELQSALTRIEQELLEDWASAYAEQYSDYTSLLAEQWDGPPRPERVEIPFGHPGDAAEEETEEQYECLRFGRGTRETRVCGRIDRVDVGRFDSAPVFNVIDYKTGRRLPRFSPEDVQSGRAIQLALYTLAVQRLELAGSEATPYQMGYWSLRETGFVAGLKGTRKNSLKPVEAAVLETLEKTLDELIPRLAAAMRSGTFAVYSQDPNCTGYCPYSTVCRVNQIRPLENSLNKRLEL